MEKQRKADEKDKIKRERALLREKNEAQVCNDLILIYPIISYENEYLVDTLYR